MTTFSPKTMTDPTGAAVPVRFVPAIDKERDRLVRRLHARALKISAELAAFRRDALNEIDGFIRRAAEAHQVKLGGSKDGVVLSSFDGRIRVERRHAETLAFDERLQLAQRQLTDWIGARTEGVDKSLQTLIAAAFRTGSGGLRTTRIVGLLRLNITDPQWLSAMALIRESMTASVARTHVRIYERRDRADAYTMIALDVAQVGEPEAGGQ